MLGGRLRQECSPRFEETIRRRSALNNALPDVNTCSWQVSSHLPFAAVLKERPESGKLSQFPSHLFLDQACRSAKFFFVPSDQFDVQTIDERHLRYVGSQSRHVDFPFMQ